MVNIIKRMRKLHELLWIRCGPGALVLPKEVSKISMEFHKEIFGGHRGAKKFWRECLPRIKYRNPSVPIQISRHSNPDGPSLLHIYTKSSSTNTSTPTSSSPQDSSSAPPSSTPNAQTTLVPETSTPTHTIDTRNKEPSAILAELVKLTGAEEIQATEQEVQEMKEIVEFKERSEKDRVEVREKLMKERREAELLRLARGEAVETN